MSMNKDQVRGRIAETKGKIEEEAGDVQQNQEGHELIGAAADLSRSGIDQPTLLSAGTISYYRSTHVDAR